MGNSHNDPDYFNQRDWLEVPQPNTRITLWENKNNRNFHIEEHKIYTLDSQQMSSELDLYYRRKNHSRWVSALYFKEKGSQQFCVSRSTAHIYIEKIPIRLSDLRHLTQADAIHIYDQCLQGFAELASLFGCFRVHPEFIGVNEKGIIKVWAGQNWSQLSIIGNKVSQQDMVRTIVDCIENNTIRYENSQNHSSIKNFIYRNSDSLTFYQASRELRQYANQYNQGVIPDRLDEANLNRQFDQFLDPLLRSSHDREPYLSQTQKSNYIPQYEPPKQEPVSTFRKVESPTGPSDKVYESSQHVTINNSNRSQGQQKFTGLGIHKQVSHEYRQLDSYRQPSENRISQNYEGYPQYKISTPPMTFENRREYREPTRSRFGSPSGQIKFQVPSQYSSSNRISEDSNKPSAYSTSNQYIRPISSQDNSLGNRNPVPAINFQSPNIPKQTSSVSFNIPPQQYSPPPQASKPQNVISLPPRSNYSQPEQLRAAKPDNRGGFMPESIIMQLYKSQDKFPGSASNKDELPMKQLGAIRKTESIREQSQQHIATSATIISSEPNPLLGIPYQGNTPTTSHLQSIQQLNSQYYPYQSSNHTRQNSQLTNHLQNRVTTNSNLTNSTKGIQIKGLDPNDGKSSQEMMQLLRSFTRKETV